jgi:hypothetical protein
MEPEFPLELEFGYPSGELCTLQHGVWQGDEDLWRDLSKESS